MTSMNINAYLFHAMKPYKFNHKEKVQDEIKILTNIISTGAILSRRHLKTILSEEEWNKLCEGHKTNWNKLDWVSIAPSNHPTIKFPDDGMVCFDMSGMPAFSEHIVKYPSIILDPVLLNDLRIANLYDDEYFGCQTGEIQVKDKIPSDYFVGIALPDVYDSSELIKNNTSEWNQYLYQKLKELEIEEFMNRYYQTAILFEKALENIHCKLPVFHIESGNPVLPYHQEFKKLTEIKTKILTK